LLRGSQEQRLKRQHYLIYIVTAFDFGEAGHEFGGGDN